MAGDGFHLVVVMTLTALLHTVHTSGDSVIKGDKNVSSTFAAAVYAHRPVIPNPLVTPTFEYAKSIIQDNLDIYEEQARIASEQGAKIIVFPEDGTFGSVFDRESLFFFLEVVPDPSVLEHPHNPCDEFTDNHTMIPVQYGLSCTAKSHNIYVVANSGTYILCDKTLDPDCPSEGRYQYNTNLIFDPKGNLIGRYHKQTLYYESQFDVPKSPEYTVVETPYGKFGTFVCFDVLFKEPAVELVEKHKVDGILFSTAWMNEMPFMQAVGFHEAWAIRMGVNFLSAEIQFPLVGFAGSGLYAGAAGSVGYYNDHAVLSHPKLVIAELPVSPPKPTLVDIPFPPDKGSLCGGFTAQMEGNVYTFSQLCENEGTLFLKVKNTICHLSYKFDGTTTGSDVMYALAAFDGLHTSAHNSYIQVCAIVSCSGHTGCGTTAQTPNKDIQSLTITGQFSTAYVFPSVVFSEYKLDKSAWGFAMDPKHNIAKLTMKNNHRPFYVSSLYGRVYKLDTPSVDGPVQSMVQSSAVNSVIKPAGMNTDETQLLGASLESSSQSHDTYRLKFNLGLAITTTIVVLALLILVVMWQDRQRNRTFHFDKSDYIRL